MAAGPPTRRPLREDIAGAAWHDGERDPGPLQGGRLPGGRSVAARHDDQGGRRATASAKAIRASSTDPSTTIGAVPVRVSTARTR